MDVREGDRHDAAGVEDRDALFARRLESLVSRNEELPRNSRCEPGRAPQPDDARKRYKPRLLKEAQHRGGRTHDLRAAEECAQKPPSRSLARRIEGSLGTPDLHASGFDELTVRNARRADRLAGSAIEALPHLRHEARAEQIETRFADGFDETNTAAWARGFCHSLEIGGAGWQAETAPNAGVVYRRVRLVGSAKASFDRLRLLRASCKLAHPRTCLRPKSAHFSYRKRAA